MTVDDRLIRLKHMLDYAREALSLMRHKTRADLRNNRQLNLAVTRLLEMIGEAAKRVPNDLQARSGSIPWAEVISLRNRLVHGYDSVDLDIVWQIVSEDLPDLVRSLEETLQKTPYQ